jgi:2'-5' RNA ligase
MFSIKEQKDRFNNHWNKFSPLFKENICEEADPLPIYVIGVHLHQSLYEEMTRISEDLQKLHSAKDTSKDMWLTPKLMHITLELPGRIGKHFQENDLSFIKDSLYKITSETPKFNITLGNLNCFPTVIMREVYDETNNFYELHNQIAKTLPFSEHPEYRFENFMPHMSICYFGGGATGNLIKHPDFKRELDFVEMPVEKIYFLKASDIGFIYKEEMIEKFNLKYQKAA